MPPPHVRFGRITRSARTLTFAAAALIGGEAVAQLGLEHDWAKRYGSNHASRNDYGKGVTVLDDEKLFGELDDHLGGTVVSVGEYTGIYNGALGTASLKAYTTFETQTLGGIPGAWSRQFKEVVNGQGNVTANGVAASSPFIEGNRRHAFTVGWFSGTVSFEAPEGNQTATNLKDAYIARIDRETQSTNWVTAFTGLGDQVCLAVAAGPPCGLGYLAGGPNVRYHTCADFGAAGSTLAAAVGYFTNQITFPHYNPINDETLYAVGNEDAFIALVHSDQTVNQKGKVFHAIRIGSTGNDRVTGAVWDQADQSLYVTGYFSGTDINFDPDYHPAAPWNDPVIGPDSYSGGTDIFVAKYQLEADPEFTNPPQTDLRLVWVCTKGTTGNDSGAGIALDAEGYAYATGWMRDAGGTRDIWVARYLRDSGCIVLDPGEGFGGPGDPVPAPVANWSYQYSALGDQAANGIALDGLDRLLITGQFAGTVDFNRGLAVDNRASAGGYDIFLTRLLRFGQYDGTYTFGALKDDIGASVAVDPVRSMRVAHAGWFGAPDAPNTYQVDFDPIGTAFLTCKGKADGYAAALVPTFPAGVQNQVTLVIDNGTVVEADYAAMIAAYHAAIVDGAVVPRTGKTALNAVFFGTPDQGYPGTAPALEVMPWTVIDNLTTATLFADRLRNLARWDGQQSIDEGLDVARDSHERAAESMGLDACYHVLSVSADRKNYNDVPGVGLPDGQGAPDLFNAVYNGLNGSPAIIPSAYVDQIDGFGGLPVLTQDYFTSYMTASDVAGAAFALETIEDDPFEDLKGFRDPIFPVYLKIMLAREAHCPGDYNGDGQVDGDDQIDFDADWGNQVKKADLNWDGAWDPADKAADQAIFDILEAIGCCP